MQGFIIPDRDTASHLDVKHDPTAATLDLSVKKPSTKLDIPSIHVIKPEPEDNTESVQSLSVSDVTQVTRGYLGSVASHRRGISQIFAGQV